MGKWILILIAVVFILWLSIRAGSEKKFHQQKLDIMRERLQRKEQGTHEDEDEDSEDSK